MEDKLPQPTASSAEVRVVVAACQVMGIQCTLSQDAGVAQSAEQRFCKPQVGGSIPLASSTFSGTFTLDFDPRKSQ
jgi:hypothetical protein